MIDSMDVVVQRVRTSWTKASRGGAGAAARNAAPTVFSLPPGLHSGLHEVVIRESDAFSPQMSEQDLSDPGLVLRSSQALTSIAQRSDVGSRLGCLTGLSSAVQCRCLSW